MSSGVPRRRLLATSACTALATLAGCRKAPEPAWKTQIAGLEKRIPQVMHETHTPGLAMAIIRNSRIAWQGAFGVKDRATNAPVDPSTIFEAASMSKPVFAYAVMKLTGHVDRSICGRYEADLEVCASDIDEYMQTNLLAPFKMDSSGYLGPASGKEHLARGHDADGVPFRAKTPGPVNLERANAARYAAMGGSGPTSKCRTARDTRSSGRSGGEWPTAQQVTGFVILTNGDNGWKLIQQLAPDASQWIHTR